MDKNVYVALTRSFFSNEPKPFGCVKPLASASEVTFGLRKRNLSVVGGRRNGPGKRTRGAKRKKRNETEEPKKKRTTETEQKRKEKNRTEKKKRK